MILILGTGRSGTTWLAKLLDSHPDVLYRHEPDYVRPSLEIPFLPERRDVERYLEPAARYLVELAQDESARAVGKRPLFGKSYRGPLRHGAFIAALTALEIVEAAGFRTAVQLPRSLEKRATAEAITVIKSVNSLCRAFLFSQAMPRLKIIHILRHPCGVIASQLRGIAAGLMPGSVYLHHLCRMAEADRYPFDLTALQRSSLETQMAYSWMITNEKVIDEMQGYANYILLLYEDLCNDIINVAKKMFEHGGIGWRGQTADFIGRLDRKRVAGYFSVRRAPGSALHRWRSELSRQQVERIAAVTSCSRLHGRFAW